MQVQETHSEDFQKQQQKQKEKETRVAKSKETPTLVKNVGISYHSDRYFKPLKEGETPHENYASWFLLRTKEEIEKKKQSIRKECIDDKLKLHKRKLLASQKKMKHNIKKTLENYDDQITKQNKLIETLRKKEESMVNKINDIKHNLEKTTSRLNEETEGFAEDHEQLNKFIEHLKLNEPHRLKSVTRLVQRQLQLQEELAEMEDSKDETGEVKKYGKFSDLKDDNEVAIEEIMAKIQELEMQKDEEQEKVDDFDTAKIDELVEEHQQTLLKFFIEPTDDDLRYKFNRLTKLPAESQKKLHKFAEHAKWKSLELTNAELIKAVQKETDEETLL